MSAATDYVQLTHAASEIDGTIDEVYAARGSYGNLSLKIASKQDALSQSQLAAANSGITAAKLTADETALGEVINGGAAGTKNLFPSFDTKSSGSVTYSYANGTVSASGTKSSGVNYVDIVENRQISELGLHIGDIIKLYNTSDNLRLGVVLGDGTTFDSAITAGNEVKEVTIGTGKTHIYIRMQILSTVTGTINLSSTPMICRKAIYDVNPDYEPYAPAKTNVEITPAIVELVDAGAKNLLNCSLTEIKSDSYNSGGAYQFTWNGNVCTTPRGVTFTINSDNSIDVVATSVTADVWFRIKQNFQYDVGSYVMSGCPSGGSTTTYFIESDNLNVRDTGNSIVINRSSTYTDNIFLVVKSGMTFTGTFKPMFCSKAAWDISHKFVPYCPSMQEMYQLILALQNGTRSAPALAKAEPEVEPETGEEETR